MRLVLVRHGRAGSKAIWAGADEERPLDRRGRRQAEALASELAELRPALIFSSPFLRCIETVAPLADVLALPVISEKALAPGSAAAAVDLAVRLTAGPGSGGFVLCTHRETLVDLLPTLMEGSEATLPLDPPGAKGCAWVLELRRGRVVGVRYLTPGG